MQEKRKIYKLKWQRKRRKAEKTFEKAKRLKENRKRIRNKRKNETYQERQTRLEKDRERIRNKRKNETYQQRQKRLQKNKQRYENKKKIEIYKKEQKQHHNNPRILKLTLKAEPFALIATGEKKKEFRKINKWIVSRLVEKTGGFKTYEYIDFSNGYSKDSPWCRCEFKGIEIRSQFKQTYSTGLTVKFRQIPHFILKIGKVIRVKNFEFKKQTFVKRHVFSF